jgi:hypothetical protein
MEYTGQAAARGSCPCLLEVGFLCMTPRSRRVSQLGEFVGGAGRVRRLADIGAERLVLFLGLVSGLSKAAAGAGGTGIRQQSAVVRLPAG